MTKAELIKFLEPFSDEIQIITVSIEGVSRVKAQYLVMNEDSSLQARMSGLDLYVGEGVILV